MTSGIEIVPAPPDTNISQRPSTGRFTSISKKANPGNLPMAASGTSNSLRTGSSNVGFRNPTATRRSGLSESASVITTSTKRANRSGPTVYLDSTPPETLSLLSTVAAASARKAHVNVIAQNLYRAARVWSHGQPLWGSTCGPVTGLAKRVVLSYSAIHAPSDDPRHHHPFDRP